MRQRFRNWTVLNLVKLSVLIDALNREHGALDADGRVVAKDAVDRRHPPAPRAHGSARHAEARGEAGAHGIRAAARARGWGEWTCDLAGAGACGRDQADAGERRARLVSRRLAGGVGAGDSGRDLGVGQALVQRRQQSRRRDRLRRLRAGRAARRDVPHLQHHRTRSRRHDARDARAPGRMPLLRRRRPRDRAGRGARAPRRIPRPRA